MNNTHSRALIHANRLRMGPIPSIEAAYGWYLFYWTAFFLVTIKEFRMVAARGEHTAPGMTRQEGS